MSITRRQALKPQGRPWNVVADMLVDIIGERPQLVVCKGCRGEHVCVDDSLTIDCSCGVRTQFERYVLFHGWSSLTWGLAMTANHKNAVDCSNPLRTMSLVGARVIGKATNPKPPIDVRVAMWRLRRAV